MATVVGTFRDHDQAERAVRQLRSGGFTENEISIVARDEGRQGGGGGEGRYGTETADDFGGENVGDGTAWGGALGAAGGLMAGAGALAIPGIGPIIAAGPLAATLSGAVAGGVAGGLVDLGIPEEEARQHEEEIKQGNILAVIECGSDKVEEASRVMREHNAENVKTHGQS